MKFASLNSWTCALGLAVLSFVTSHITAASFNPPPAPSRRVTDEAKVLSPNVVSELNARLEQFEGSTSSQIVLAIYAKIPEGTTLEEFSVKSFQAWKLGQKGKDNGVALFAFIQDRKLRIEVGYGLEGAIPDAIAKRIIEESIAPHLRRGDYNSAFRLGIEALIRAAQGEPFRGNGRPVGTRPRGGTDGSRLLMFFGLFLFLAFLSNRSKRGTIYAGRRDLSSGSGMWVFPGTGWGSGGGGSWGGGGGFSGGGGRSGGGGASGSW